MGYEAFQSYASDRTPFWYMIYTYLGLWYILTIRYVCIIWCIHFIRFIEHVWILSCIHDIFFILQIKWEFSTVFNSWIVSIYYWNSVGAIENFVFRSQYALDELYDVYIIYFYIMCMNYMMYTWCMNVYAWVYMQYFQLTCMNNVIYTWCMKMGRFRKAMPPKKF